MWANRDWVGRSLPADTPAGRELDAYARVVNAVEGNTTFYATPDTATIAGVCAIPLRSSGRFLTASSPSGIVSVR